MFEQATLSNGPAGKRVWTTFLGLTSQLVLVSFAVLAPMIWPQGLPIRRLALSLTPPVPPGPRQLGDRAPKHAVRVVRAWKDAYSLGLVQPIRVPDRVTMLDEEPAGDAVIGAPTGSASGPDTGVVGSILSDLERNTPHVAPPIVAEKPPAQPAAPAPAAIKRYVTGGDVRLGRLHRKVQPQYPAIAKAAHVFGDVVLECVVGIDGRILEVKVKSGNPLLVRAAEDAVWQWVYEPSRLNGLLIEIITNITVSFKLN
jgi:periplasmic protein TonB